MGYEVPTFAELREQILDDIALQFDAVDRSEHSDNYAQASVLASLAEGEYGYLDWIARQVSPIYAEGDILDRWGEVFGVTRLGEHVAGGTVRVSGTVGSAIPADTLASYVGGQQYSVTVEALIPEAGWVDVQMESTATGYDQNRQAGDELVFDSPPPGVNSTAAVVAMSGGRPVELDEEYRPRILLRTQNTPGGGNVTDWERWTLEVAGPARAWVMPLRRGLGTVDVIPIGPASGKILSQTVRSTVVAHLEDRRPVTCDLGVYLPVANPLDVRIEVLPAAGYEFDWEGEKTVQAGSTVAYLILDSVSGLEVGDRLVCGLEQREISAIDEEALKVTLDRELAGVPANPSTVYPGGPLYEPVRDAIASYFHDLDPLQTWYLNACEAVAHVAGVVNQTITLPAADQELADDVNGPPMHTLGSLIMVVAP